MLQLHPDYAPTRFWAFDGVVPGPLIRAKYGEPVHGALPQPPAVGEDPAGVRHRRDDDPSAQRPYPVGERRQPGQLLQLDQRPQRGQSVRLQGPALSERARRLHRSACDLVGNPTEALGSLWYHDHHLDFTAQNVYKGMFGCYNLFDELDTGEEAPG